MYEINVLSEDREGCRAFCEANMEEGSFSVSGDRMGFATFAFRKEEDMVAFSVMFPAQLSGSECAELVEIDARNRRVLGRLVDLHRRNVDSPRELMTEYNEIRILDHHIASAVIEIKEAVRARDPRSRE